MSLDDPDVVRAEYASERGLLGLAGTIPASFEGPLRARRAPCIFVAETAA